MWTLEAILDAIGWAATFIAFRPDLMQRGVDNELRAQQRQRERRAARRAAKADAR